MCDTGVRVHEEHGGAVAVDDVRHGPYEFRRDLVDRHDLGERRRQCEQRARGGLLPAAVLERSRRVECRGREARVGLEDAPLGRQEAAAASVDRGQPAVVPLG